MDVGPAASHPDARPVSPADEIRRIAPLLDALSIDSPCFNRQLPTGNPAPNALKRGVGYLNDIQGFPDPALYPDIAEADCRLVVMHSAQRGGIATRTGHQLDQKTRSTKLCGSSRRGFPPCDGAGSLPTGSSLDPGMGFS
ncbi:dihydropteroate synthase [Klebsiella pneumoniae]|uniref:dihydropteroate synthase n=1 Tax=Klebsiella pneumoniae TaxID=573 RepID=UPI0039BDDCE0